MDQSFNERLTRAIRRVGKTEAERATKLGYSSRHIDNIERGEGLARILETWEKAGVIHIAGDCPCSTNDHADIAA